MASQLIRCGFVKSYALWIIGLDEPIYIYIYIYSIYMLCIMYSLIINKYCINIFKYLNNNCYLFT